MLTVSNLSTDLDAAKVDAAHKTLAQMVLDAEPTVAVLGGAFDDLVLRFSAILAAANADNLDRLRRSASLLEVNKDPDLADTDVLDRIASNYKLTRIAAASATGSITIVLSAQVATTIGQGTVFASPTGATFTADSTITARVNSGDVLYAGDRLLTAQADGTYAFTIPTTAESEGVSGNIRRLVQFTPKSTIQNLVQAYAAADFTGGTDEESNTSLSNRIQSGTATPSLASRPGIEAVIRVDSRFTAIPGVSVVGYGDTEQLRYHSIFPMAIGSRVDAYVRTAYQVETLELTKLATFIEAVSGGGIWQMTIGRDDAPGFYEIERINRASDQATDAGYNVTADTRGFDVTSSTVSAGLSFLPDVTSGLEAAFSRYQTAVIRFLDTDTPTGSLVPSASTASYRVIVKLTPDLDAVQDLISDRSVRSPDGDCLVKGPVPCFTAVGVTISQKRGEPTLDTGAIQQEVADAVNQIGFTGRLAASVVTNAIQIEFNAQGASNSTVSAVGLSGRIRRPDGTIVNISGTSTMSVPDDPMNMVSARTVAFFLNPSDVSVVVNVVDIPDV